MLKRSAFLVLLIVGLAVPATAGAVGGVPTIYSSLPLQGAAKPDTTQLVQAEQLALAQAGGKAGATPVQLVSLDDATKAAGNWDPEQVAKNARQAVADPDTIAYIGEYNSGASMISMPILNRAGIPQISPASTYTGLTRPQFAGKGEPGGYFPTGTRTFVRVAPADNLQADGVAALLQGLKVKKVYVVEDGDLYGWMLASMATPRLKVRGIRRVGHATLNSRGSGIAALARRIAASKAGAMFFAGVTANHAPELWRAVHKAAPKMWLVGADGVAESGLGRGLGSAYVRTRAISAQVPYADTSPLTARFVTDFKAAYGKVPIGMSSYGYEAMQLALSAIAVGGTDRAAVVRALFATKDRASVLGGKYSLDEYGDPTSGGFDVLAFTRTGSLSYLGTLRVGR